MVSGSPGCSPKDKTVSANLHSQAFSAVIMEENPVNRLKILS
jgi:hypothetical protein